MPSSPPSSTTVALAAGEAAAGGVHQGGAGAGAAGERQAGAAFPDPQADAVGGQHLGEADIGALGKQRRRVPAPGRWLAIGTASRSATKKVACGLPIEQAAGSATALVRRGRGAACRPRRRAGCPASRAGAGPFHGHPPIRQHVGGQARRPTVWMAEAAAAGFGGEQGGDAAGGVAAGAGFAAVRVEDAHEHVGASRRAPARSPGRSRCPGGRSAMAAARRGVMPSGRGARVEHDEVVPAAVHLEEGRVHAGGYMGSGASHKGAAAARTQASVTPGSPRCRARSRWRGRPRPGRPGTYSNGSMPIQRS